MSEEKTEKPTPKKLKESRKEGQVPRTQELGAWASMLVVAVSLSLLVEHAADAVRELLVRVTGVASHATEADTLILLGEGGRLALLLSAVLGAGILLIGVLAGASQGGIHLATKLMRPKWSRLNPLEGAKRMFGPHALWEGGKVLLKSAVVTFFVWRAVEALMPLLGGLVPLDLALEIVVAEAIGLMRDVALAGLVAAAADYAFQRRKVGKQVRMSHKEIRDEHKQTEGDPLVRQALRSRQLASARNRMMSAVPKADVVLVNPTHVAVALAYDPERGAPRVVAKGAGVVATRIRDLAETSRVPMVEDVPLARALHRSCEIGQEIPAALYEAVAQVLAFVLSRRKHAGFAPRYRSPRDGAPLPDVSGSRRRLPRVVAASADPSGPPAIGR